MTTTASWGEVHLKVTATDNPIDRDSPVPIYYQLERWMSERITRGAWNPGDQLPTEDEFCVAFHVSRATIRQATAGLVSRGLVHKEPGRGVFVGKETVRP